MTSGKIKIELDREDALLLREFLDGVNFYIVGTALYHRTDNAGVTEDDAERHTRAVNHAWRALEKALNEQTQ